MWTGIVGLFTFCCSYSNTSLWVYCQTFRGLNHHFQSRFPLLHRVLHSEEFYSNSQLNKNFWKLLCVLNILATAVQGHGIQSVGLLVEQLWNDVVMGRNKNVPGLKLLHRQTHISERISSEFGILIQHPLISRIIVKVEQIKQILKKKVCQVKWTLWRSCSVRRWAISAFPHLPQLIHLSKPQPWGAECCKFNRSTC